MRKGLLGTLCGERVVLVVACCDCEGKRDRDRVESGSYTGLVWERWLGFARERDRAWLGCKRA